MAPDGKSGSVPTSAVVYDPYHPGLPETIRNPFPVYHELRATEPVHFSARLNFWVLTRYSDVSSVLRDPRFAGGPARLAHFFSGYSPEERQRVAPLVASLGRWTLFKDAPEHTRLRAIIGKLFLSNVSEPLRPTIEKLTAELLDAVADKKKFDLIAALAYPLPVMVIGALLGLPAEDNPLLKHWSDVLASFMARLGRTFDTAVKADEAVREMETYLREVLRQRRANPTDDILSRLATVETAEGRLTDDEVVSTAAMLLFGGHETTTNLIGNGALAFLRNEEQWELLRVQPERVTNAVEEVLRYDSPVQFIGRIAKEGAELGGKRIMAGEMVLNVLGAANRDPQVFADPDGFRIGRENASKHLAFGQGIHFCIGAPLSRIEGASAFLALARRFPRLRLVDESRLKWNEALGFRGVEKLEVAID